MSTKEINETREKIQSLIETLRKIKYVKNPIVKKDDTIHELNRILLRLKDDEVRQDPTLIQNLSMQAEKIFRESLAQELYVIQNAEFNNYNANQVVVLQAALAAQLITEQQLRNAIAVRNQRIAQLEANLANEQARVQQLTGDLAQRNADIGVLNQQVQQLTADVNARNAQIAAHQNQIRLIENQLRNIKLAREHFRQVAQQETLRANQAEQKVNQAEQKVNQAEQNANQLAIANQGLTNQLEQKSTEFEHLEGAFQYRENEYKALDQAYSLVVREVKQMEAELKAKVQELNAANQQNERLLQDAVLKDQELKTKDQELKQLEQKLSTKEQELENKNAELKRLEHELNNKEQELSAKDLELKVSEQNLARIRKAYIDSQEDKRRLHEEKLNLEERIKFLAAERDKLLQNLKSMTKTADELRNQIISEQAELAKQKTFYQTKLAEEQNKYENLNRLYQDLTASNKGNLQVNSEQQKTIDELTIAFKSQKALIAELETKLQSQKDELAKKHQLIGELTTKVNQGQINAQDLQAKIKELEALNSKQAAELKQISKEKAQLEAQIIGLEQEIKTNKARLLELEEINDELGKNFDENAKKLESLISEISALANGQEYEFKNPVFGQLAQLLKKSTGNTLQERIQWFGQQIGLIGSLKKKVTDQKIMIDELQSNQGQKASLAEQEILAIQADLEAKQKEIAELQQKLAEKENELRDSNIRNINYSTKINEINSELIRLRNTTEQNKAQIKFLEEQLEESQSKELKLREVGMKYSEIQQELNETKARLANKQKMLEAHTKLRESATKRMQENKSLNNKITELEKQLEQKETDYQSKLDNLQKQLAELGKIVQDDKEIQRKHQLELQVQKQQFEAERKQATQKLNEEMQELMSLLDEATIKAKQKNDELLKQQEFHIKRMQTLTNKNAELEKELNNKKTQEDQLLRKITSVISNISFDAMDLDTAIDSFIAEYQKLEKLSTEQKALLEKQARELKTQTELLSAKQSEEQSKVNVTFEELTNLQAKIKEQENHIKVLEEENKNLAKANQQLEQENSELKKANLELEKLKQQYDEIITKQHENITSLREQNEKLESIANHDISDLMIQVEQKLKIVYFHEFIEDPYYQTKIDELISMLSSFQAKGGSYLESSQSATIAELIEKLEKRKNIAIDLETNTNIQKLTSSELNEFNETVSAIKDVYSEFDAMVNHLRYQMHSAENQKAHDVFVQMEREFLETELKNINNYLYINENSFKEGKYADFVKEYEKILAEKDTYDNTTFRTTIKNFKMDVEQALYDYIFMIKQDLIVKEKEIKKLARNVKDQEMEIKELRELESKSQELLKRFEKFGSSAFEQVQLLRKQISELNAIQFNASGFENIIGLNKILKELESISQEAQRMNVDPNMPVLEYVGRGEPPARKPIKGGHDPSQIHQVQQVTGLAAIFGAFGILRFLMYAIIVVVLIVMVWHLFSSWRQEQSCRPYLADIYGLENEYYNHYIYS